MGREAPLGTKTGPFPNGAAAVTPPWAPWDFRAYLGLALVSGRPAAPSAGLPNVAESPDLHMESTVFTSLENKLPKKLQNQNNKKPL